MRFARTIAVTLTILSTPAALAIAMDPDPVRSCIQDICGPVDKLVNAQGAGNFSRFSPEDVKVHFEKEIALKINLGFNIELDLARNFLKRWDALETWFKLENLTAEQRQLLALAVFFSSDLKGIGQSLKFASGGTWTVDRELWKKVEPGRSQAQIDAIAGYYEHMLNDWDVQRGNSLEDASFEFYKKWYSIKTEEDLKANAKTMLGNVALLTEKVVSSAVGHGPMLKQIGCKKARHMNFHEKIAETGHDEEDWADTFAAAVIREYEKEWPYAKNFACLLMPIDQKKEDLDMSRVNIKEDVEESHSTAVFRLISTQIDLGRPLPASCLSIPAVKLVSFNKCGP